LLGFCGTREGTPSESDQSLLQRVTNQVALAVENALNYESFTTERDRLKLLLDVNAAVVKHLDLKSLIEAVAECLRRLMRYEYTSLAVHEPRSDGPRVGAIEVGGKRTGHETALKPIVEASPAVRSTASRRTSSPRTRSAPASSPPSSRPGA
jgi:transcriptional regulator with GAF, ATPase, and Fis domain